MMEENNNDDRFLTPNPLSNNLFSQNSTKLSSHYSIDYNFNLDNSQSNDLLQKVMLETFGIPNEKKHENVFSPKNDLPSSMCVDNFLNFEHDSTMLDNYQSTNFDKLKVIDSKTCSSNQQLCENDETDLKGIEWSEEQDRIMLQEYLQTEHDLEEACSKLVTILQVDSNSVRYLILKFGIYHCVYSH